jgi:hypothetical protein
MFVGNAESLPKSAATEKCSTGVGSGLSCIHLTKLESLARDKKTNLIRMIINYGHKSFVILGLESKVIILFNRNFQIFVKC